MHTIRPILCGVITARKGGLTYRVDHDVELSFPVLTFLVTPDDPGDDTVVLVDTGVKSSDDPYILDRGRKIGPPGGGPGPLVDGLAAYGIAPEDVDYVVLSHLHHDHSSNNDRFPDAEFVVHEAELAAARDPLPVFARSYPEDNVRSLDDLDVTTIGAEHELRPGIALLHTPGHTQGQLSMVVDTARGPHALVGDLAYVQHNLELGLSSLVDSNGNEVAVTPSAGDYLPPGVHTDVVACYDSIRRIRERIGDQGNLVPSHDPRLVGRTLPDPYWE